MFESAIKRFTKEFGPPYTVTERWRVPVRGGVAAPLTVSVGHGKEPGTSEVWVFSVCAPDGNERITRGTVRSPDDIEKLVRFIRSAAARE
jgi:hypothetical protein